MLGKCGSIECKLQGQEDRSTASLYDPGDVVPVVAGDSSIKSWMSRRVGYSVNRIGHSARLSPCKPEENVLVGKADASIKFWL